MADRGNTAEPGSRKGSSEGAIRRVAIHEINPLASQQQSQAKHLSSAKSLELEARNAPESKLFAKK
jgi:hypothetical protein